jgi:hypothetical protein
MYVNSDDFLKDTVKTFCENLNIPHEAYCLT